MKSGNLNFLEPSGPLQACNGTALPLPLPQFQASDQRLDRSGIFRFTISPTKFYQVEDGDYSNVKERNEGYFIIFRIYY